MPMPPGSGKKLIGELQRATFRPANQGLITEQGTDAKIDDRLENRRQQTLSNNSLQLEKFIIQQHVHRLSLKITHHSVYGENVSVQ